MKDKPRSERRAFDLRLFRLHQDPDISGGKRRSQTCREPGCTSSHERFARCRRDDIQAVARQTSCDPPPRSIGLVGCQRQQCPGAENEVPDADRPGEQRHRTRYVTPRDSQDRSRGEHHEDPDPHAKPGDLERSPSLHESMVFATGSGRRPWIDRKGVGGGDGPPLPGGWGGMRRAPGSATFGSTLMLRIKVVTAAGEMRSADRSPFIAYRGGPDSNNLGSHSDRQPSRYRPGSRIRRNAFPCFGCPTGSNAWLRLTTAIPWSPP